MAKLIQPNDSVGKTIATVWDAVGSLIVLRFADGDYLAVRAELDYDDAAELRTDRPVIAGELSREQSVRLGLFTAAEWDAEMAEVVAAREHNERQEYERLAAKYAAKPTPG